MPLTLSQLQAFLNVAEGGSFIEGARRQAISQPALSRTIREIEATVGARLFDRDTRGTALTPIGRELVGIARRLLNHTREEFELIDRLVSGVAGLVSIAALPTLSAHILPSAIARYRQEHPAVAISVRETPADQVFASVLSGEADCGLVDEPPSDPRYAWRYTWQALTRDELGLVCRSDDPILKAAECTWSLFEGRPFIAMAPSTSVRHLTDQVFAAAQIAPQRSVECTQLESVGHFIDAGLGISALPKLGVAFLGTFGLVWRGLTKPIVTRRLGIVTRRHATQSEAARQFVRLLVKSRNELALPRHFQSRK